MTQRTCRLYGGFEPDIRHRTNDATVSLALVARGLAVTLLPDLVLGDGYPGVALRPIAGAPVERAIAAVTRAADATRPSVKAVLERASGRKGARSRAQRPEHGQREHDPQQARRTAARPARRAPRASASTANQSAWSRCG